VADVVTIEMSARLQTPLVKPHGVAVGAPRPSDLVDDIGLGLAVIVALGRRIVRDLHVDSGPDGDRIVLTLALDRGVVAPSASRPRVMQDVSLVLLVEDNDSNRRLVERLVERRPHVQLRSLSRGGECHSEAVELRPALVLLDLDLPDLDGVEVLEQLRADRTTSDIPVVVVSADATPARQRELMRRGAAGYITKPLDVGAFYSILDEFVPTAG
jgi:CheY-like chemotaxis protein